MGRVCKAVFPIPERLFYGDPGSPVAVCTLSSMGLLERLAGSSEAMRDIAIAGRLLSENRGIDSMIRGVTASPGISAILLCGTDTAGHLAGRSLVALHQNGVDRHGRIVGSPSPDPVLASPRRLIERFCSQVQILDMAGQTGHGKIARVAASLRSAASAASGG